MLEIIDLKYGKGVPVSAQDNSQLKLYALGALTRYDRLFDVRTVRLHIYPRKSIFKNRITIFVNFVGALA